SCCTFEPLPRWNQAGSKVKSRCQALRCAGRRCNSDRVEELGNRIFLDALWLDRRWIRQRVEGPGHHHQAQEPCQDSDVDGLSRHWKEMFSAKTFPCTQRREKITR